MGHMEFKRGATFRFVGVLPLIDANGELISGAGWSITSEVRQANGQIIAVLDVDWINEAERSFVAECLEDTSTWNLGSALWDVRAFGPQGQVLYTQTVQFSIMERVTYA